MRDKYRTDPQVGNTVQGDKWTWPARLTPGDDFADSSFPGCQFRLAEDDFDYPMAVNITVTGAPHLNRPYNNFRSRCRIEFVGDGEPSTFTSGWLYHDHV